jgi:hypothetical protein
MFEMSGIGRSMDSESRLAITRGEEWRGMGRDFLMGAGFLSGVLKCS